MSRKSAGHFALLFTLVLLGAGAWAQAAREFSAIIVQNTDGKTVRQKLFVGKGKIRVEPESATPDAAILLLNFSAGASYVLMPYQKKYVEVSGLEPAGTGQMHFLNVTDPRHPCAVLPQSGKAKLPCKEVGQEIIDGRNAAKWVASLPDGTNGYVWVDSRLEFPIKLGAPGRSVQFENIREGAQEPSLFEIPAGYTRLQLASTSSAGK